MAIVEKSTILGASADAVWAAVKTPSAFRRVTRGLVMMPVIRNRTDEWQLGETVVGWVFLFGFIPFSRHHLHVASISEDSRTLTSQERGGVVRKWNHDIVVTPVNESQCEYLDRIDISAGLLTPLIVVYAHWFYRMRQRRWRVLAKELKP
ncbi:MAG: hypothetical protein F2545_02995 [Actinobacteria bacterium]|uniref:Unannotated protein n=1 Tax=freshwater metagenome TaxID=449393 RepID=A0A6J6D143_9ZZZZ|nr:hypothetical protein [Actinomycetota bacterium]